MKSAALTGKSHLRAPYTGSSRRSVFYGKARMRDLETAAKDSRTIDSFFIQTVPKALMALDIGLIRRFACKAFRYMDAYRKGLTGAEAERQVKKYKSHRRIPANWITNCH